MKFHRVLFLLACTALVLLSCRETIVDPPQLVDEEVVVYTGPFKYLALGDSYTIGESVDSTTRWPVLLRDALQSEGLSPEGAEVIATTGWTTGNLINAIDNADLQPEYGLVSLLIGVNNQYQGRSLSEYETQFEQLLSKAIFLAGGDTSRVFVVSIPDYGFTPFGEPNQSAISAEIDTFNAASRAITEQFGVRYFDITPISREGLDKPSYVANDGLHPSGEQYAAWVELCLPGVLELFVEP